MVGIPQDRWYAVRLVGDRKVHELNHGRVHETERVAGRTIIYSLLGLAGEPREWPQASGNVTTDIDTLRSMVFHVAPTLSDNNP